MAKLSKIISQLENHIEDIKEEIYNREEQADNYRDKSEYWEDSDKGSDYIFKTEALDELTDLLFDAQDKAQRIKEGDFY
jgi:hypothetical protein